MRTEGLSPPQEVPAKEANHTGIVFRRSGATALGVAGAFNEPKDLGSARRLIEPPGVPNIDH